MNRLHHLSFLLVLLLISGCSKDELVEETSGIFLKEYSIEDICFADTTIIYNFNGDRWEDFTLQIEWTFDTADIYDYHLNMHRLMWFNNYTDLICGMSKFKELETQKEWQVGDTILDLTSKKCFLLSSGYTEYSSSADSIRTHLSDIRNNDLYWAYYLESGGKIHYGWVRLNCGLIVESAFNLKPEEPILIGQRE
jgi:hypothetical protein